MSNINKSITAFIFNLSKGGAQGVFVTVMNHYYDNGYNVHVVVQNLDESVYKEELREGIRISSLGTASAKKSVIAIINYVNKNVIENAWVFGPEMAVNVYLAKKICNKKFKIYARSINTLSVEYKYTETFFRKYVTQFLVKKFFHKVDIVVAQSNNMAKDLINNFSFKEEQVVIINNALSEKFEQEIYRQAEQKEQYILYAGRLETQKGLDMLLNAFNMMNKKDVKLVILGDGSKREELMNLSEQLGICDRVRFVSYTKDIIQYYNRAMVTVLSSYYEGFPNVLIESLACGTPVVAFDLPSGPDEIIIEDVNGSLVKYLDVEALSRALDLACVKEWNCEAIKESSKKYRKDVLLKKYLDIF